MVGVAAVVEEALAAAMDIMVLVMVSMVVQIPLA